MIQIKELASLSERDFLYLQCISKSRSSVFYPLNTVPFGMQGYEDKKKASAALKTFSNGEIFNVQTNFCAELGQFRCSTSADFTCIWNNSMQNEILFFSKARISSPDKSYYGPQNGFGKRTRQTVLKSLPLAYVDSIWRAIVASVGIVGICFASMIARV